MATQPVQFVKSRYFSLHPHLNKELLVRDLLLPGLKEQGVLGLGSPGIKLPTDEYITLGEAKELVFDYLINDANLGERDQRTLRSVNGLTSFAELASAHINRAVTEPKTLGAAILPDQLVDLQTQKTAPLVNQPTQFSSDQTIRDYNAIYQKILLYSNSGTPAQILARLFPGGITAATDIKQLALAQVIVANLARLKQASQQSGERELQNYAVAQELSQTLNNYPEVVAYRNYLGNSAIQATLREYVDAIVETAQKDNPAVLEELDTLQLAYGQQVHQYLLNESELRFQIYNALPLIRDNERRVLTNQILHGMIRGSRDGTSLESVLTHLKLDQSTQLQVYTALHNQGIDISLKYSQDKIRLQLASHHLTPTEKRLLNKGINPFLTTLNPNSDKLVNKEKALLAGYNAKTTNNKQFVTLREAYDNERQKANPDPLFLIKARDILNRGGYYASLTPWERTQVGFAGYGRWFANTTSRIHDIHDRFIDSVFDITDTVTGKKWLYKQWDRLDAFTAKVTIPGTQIPLFHINTWVARQWDQFKRLKVEGWITKSASSTSWFGRTFHTRLKDYKLGGFTLKGMTHVGLSRAWSNLAYKASAGVVKKGAVFTFRTATRFFLKVGAKTLAKATFKLGELAVSGLLSLSGILTALGVVLLVKDVIEIAVGIAKWGWEQLKKIFPNTEGAIAWVTTVTITSLAGMWATSMAFIVGLLGPLIFPTLVTIAMVFSVAFGSLYLFTYLGHGFNMSIHLDSGAAIFAAIFCNKDQDGAPTSPVTTAVSTTPSITNSVVSCANCLVDYLTACYGPAVTGAKIQTTGIGCLIARTVAPKVAAIIERSATSYTYLQCVGFVQASIACAGGSLEGKNACNYTTGAAGYRFVAGLSGAKPGDPIVFNSSSTCSDGAPGHIGIMSQDAGALVCLIDANQVCNGCVSGNNCLPKTGVAGYLQKI